MDRKKSLQILSIPMVLALLTNAAGAENIDPDEDGSQYAYGENVGWVNFEPNVPDPCAGATVSNTILTGYVWAENIGWISLSCENTSSCGTVDYGITNNGEGRLAGYAWGENVGWISLSCENTASCDTVQYGVTIDSLGNFKGLAWAENIGWIRFQGTGAVTYKVKTGWTYPCFVDLVDFSNFASQWMLLGPELDADLDGNDEVGVGDLSEFTKSWLLPCPENWSLQ